MNKVVPKQDVLTQAIQTLRCTDPDEFMQWARVAHADIGNTVHDVLLAWCHDCTPAYASEMISVHRCIRA